MINETLEVNRTGRIMDDTISRKAAMNACGGYLVPTSIIKELPPAEPHWIPCSERLPEEEGEYLVTSVYQYYRDGRKTYKTTVDRWSRNGAGKEWVATSNDAHIAWMPLPEPYKEVTE